MSVRRSEYCRCGSTIQIIATSEISAARAMAAWREGHVGDGHGPATRKVAYMARIRSDQRAKEEVKGETTLEPLAELD